MNLLDTCSLSQLFLQRQRLQELLDTEVAYASRQDRVWLERGIVLPVQWGSSPPTNRDKLTTDVRIEFRHYKVDNHGNLIGKPTPWRLCQTLASKNVGTDTEDQVRANAAHFLWWLPTPTAPYALSVFVICSKRQRACTLAPTPL